MESNSSCNFSWKFPSLYPRVADSLWFSADKPCDDENELTQMEVDYQNWLTRIGQKDSDIVPIGKTASEHFDEEDEEEEDDDDNDDDDSESNDDDEDDDLDADDLNYDRDSPVDPFH